MQQNRYIKTFLLGTMLQMAIVCFIYGLLKIQMIHYPDFLNVVFLIVGGTSSAIWGVIIAKASKKVPVFTVIIKDFFNVKQKPLHYAFVFTFLAIIFGYHIIFGRFIEGVKWYSFFTLFFASIIFGGIEEIGWRYTFQPMIEKKLSFEISCLITFGCWGIWHYMYFYLTNSLDTINHVSFLIGLLGNCFVLGSIYSLTKSLWLCVLYHCLLNVFTQTTIANNLPTVILINTVCILLAIFLVRNKKR